MKLIAFPGVRTFLLVPPMIALISVFAELSGGPQRNPAHEHETSAMMLLGVLAAGQVMFETSCGNGGYARTIDQLAAPPPGSSDGFVDASALKKVSRSYVVTLTASVDASGPADCHGRPTSRSFQATAVPAVFGKSGSHSFTITRDGAIWYSETAVAPSAPFEQTGRRIN
jgi:hypothetical protein